MALLMMAMQRSQVLDKVHSKVIFSADFDKLVDPY